MQFVHMFTHWIVSTQYSPNCTTPPPKKQTRRRQLNVALQAWHKLYFSVPLIYYALIGYTAYWCRAANRKHNLTNNGSFVWHESKQAPKKSTSRVGGTEKWAMINIVKVEEDIKTKATVGCSRTVDSVAGRCPRCWQLNPNNSNVLAGKSAKINK